MWQCNRLWHTISLAFPPFLPYIDDPPSLLGLSLPSLGQIYGLHIAYFAYHALRHHDHVSNHLLFTTIKAQITRCNTAKHLIAAHFGKARLRYSFSSQNPPRPSGATQTHTQTAGGLPPFPSTASLHNRALPNALDFATLNNRRLRLPPNRRAVLIARGVDFPAGPLFSARLHPEPSTGMGQGASD